MSITIDQQPNKFSPVFNPMEFSFYSSSISGNPFFFLLTQLKDASSNVISQSRYSPRPDNQLFKHDVAPLLEKYVSYDISGIASPSYGVRRTTGVYKEYILYSLEEYGAVASGISSGASSTSSNKFAWNGALDYNDQIGYDQASYVIASGTTAKLLTDMRGDSIRLKSTDTFEIGIMTDAGATSPVKNIVVKTYDYASTLIGTYKIANSFASGTTSPDKFLSCLVGAGDLNSTTLTSGSQPVITSSVNYYEVYVENNSGTRCSEILTFKIDNYCYKEDGVRMYWLNSLGRIDSFNFNFASDESISITKASFDRVTGAYSGNVFSRTRYESGKTNFSTIVEKKIKVQSDYLSNTEAQWMQYMIASPLHWMMYNGNLISVYLDAREYNIQTIEKNKLFNVEFMVTFGHKSYRQRL
jgi:hypothetical protein